MNFILETKHISIYFMSFGLWQHVTHRQLIKANREVNKKEQETGLAFGGVYGQYAPLWLGPPFDLLKEEIQ